MHNSHSMHKWLFHFHVVVETTVLLGHFSRGSTVPSVTQEVADRECADIEHGLFLHADGMMACLYLMFQKQP